MMRVTRFAMPLEVAVRPSSPQVDNLYLVVLDPRRQSLLHRRALSPLHGEASDLGAAGYVHDKNTADGPW